jgi:hypothetical protein
VITTTLNEIRKYHPCTGGWMKLLKHLGKTQADDEPLAFVTILDSNGFHDCCWAMRTRPDLNNLWRHFAVDCAERVKHLMVNEHSINALAVARRHALGLATDGELKEAKAAWAVEDAAWAVAWAAARAAAWEAWAAAAWAAAWEAWAAEAREAREAERAWQTERLRHLLTVGEWTPAIDAAKGGAE